MCTFDRFIEKYGTHIVVGLSVGAEDVVLVKQDKSSNMQPSDLKNHLNELGDQHFTGACSFSPSHSKSKDQKHKVYKCMEKFFNVTVSTTCDAPNVRII